MWDVLACPSYSGISAGSFFLKHILQVTLTRLLLLSRLPFKNGRRSWKGFELTMAENTTNLTNRVISNQWFPLPSTDETRFVILGILSIATRTKVSNPITSDKALNDKLVSIVILGVSTLSAVNMVAGVVGRPKPRPYWHRLSSDLQQVRQDGHVAPRLATRHATKR